MTNRFTGLDLIDRVPEGLWMEVCDIVQETVIKTISKKKKCKKAKWLSEEALQIAEKRREVKDKGEKGKIHPFECRVPKNNTEIRNKPQSSMYYFPFYRRNKQSTRKLSILPQATEWGKGGTKIGLWGVWPQGTCCSPAFADTSSLQHEMQLHNWIIITDQCLQHFRIYKTF